MNKKTKETLFSNKNDDWATPQSLINDLSKEFNFVLDVCASESNKKCNTYFSKNQNGLLQQWLKGEDGYLTRTACWCNPPYSETKLWVKKAFEEAQKGVTTVMLLAARTDTKHWHQYIFNQPNVEVRFLKGRIQFEGAPAKAPFPSAIVIFHGINEIVKDGSEEDNYISSIINAGVDINENPNEQEKEINYLINNINNNTTNDTSKSKKRIPWIKTWYNTYIQRKK